MTRLAKPYLKLVVTLGVLLSGCGGGDGDGGGGTPPATTSIAKASTNSGDTQTGTVAQPLPAPLRVVVTEGGAPLAGATVTWSTTAPGGSLDPSAAVTDATGTASAIWALGTVAGTQSAQAALSGASGSPVSFSATATPGAANELEKVSGDGQVGEVETQLPSPLVAKVSDEFGNGVPGVAVNWSASDGALSAPTVLTDQAGASAVTLMLPATVGPITITAAADGIVGSPQTYTAEATEATVTANVSVVNNSFNPSTLTISPGTTVVWTWASSAINHNVSPDGTEPRRSGEPRNGPATYSYQFDTPGTYAYYCEVHGGPGGVGMSGVITVQ